MNIIKQETYVDKSSEENLKKRFYIKDISEEFINLFAIAFQQATGLNANELLNLIEIHNKDGSIEWYFEDR